MGESSLYADERYVAIIPARGGSKGLKDKNILPLNGHPLIAYSVSAAKTAQYVDRVIVTTDSKKIAVAAKSYGAEIIDRPPELADDIIMSDAAVVHAIEQLEQEQCGCPENIVFLQPTSPLRNSSDIDQCIEQFVKSRADSLFSAVDIHPFLWRCIGETDVKPINYNPLNRKPRQNIAKDIIETGSVYVTKKDIYLNKRDRFGGKISYHLINNYCLFEIDDQNDFDSIESILKLKTKTLAHLVRPRTIKLEKSKR
jgi:N-acylneuraminate cytidylyltransferase